MTKFRAIENKSFIFKNASISIIEGELYNRSELVDAYKKFFVEVNSEELLEVLEEVQSPTEELLLDNSSDVSIIIEEEEVQEDGEVKND